VSTERSYCEVAVSACTNPAGYGCSGAVGNNPDPPRCSVTCSECGSVACPMCRVIRGGKPRCLNCLDYPEWYDILSKRVNGEPLVGGRPAMGVD